MNTAPIYSVTQVNQYIKGLLDRDGALAGLFVRGRSPTTSATPPATTTSPSRTRRGPSGASWFRREAAGLRFRPENGMKVVAFGV